MHLHVCVSSMVSTNIELSTTVMSDHVLPVHRSCNEVDSNRLRPHILRTSDFCWCDSHAKEQFSEVIEYI